VMGFWFLRDSYDPTIGFDCTAQYKCFFNSLNLGVKAGGGLGDVLTPLPYDDPNYWGRWFFDMTFWVIIVVILLKLVFGIILDTFGAIRDAKNEVELDIRTVCFVCSLKSETFERQANGFRFHVNHEHNPWMYLFFFIHLAQKNPDEYNYAEQFVFDKKKENDASFFPISRSIGLEVEDEKE
jgi:hypothetical protein